MPDEGGGTQVDDLEVADRFWEEFKHRHTHYWWLLERFVLFHSALTIVPFTVSKYLADPKTHLPFLWIFPLLAIIFAVISFWLLRAEAERLAAPARLFRTMVTKHLNEAQLSDYLLDRQPLKMSSTEAAILNRSPEKLQRALLSSILVNPTKKIGHYLTTVWLVYGVLVGLLAFLGTLRT